MKCMYGIDDPFYRPLSVLEANRIYGVLDGNSTSTDPYVKLNSNYPNQLELDAIPIPKMNKNQ